MKEISCEKFEIGQDIYEEEINVCITMEEYEKIKKYRYFIETHQYSCHDLPSRKELGKIKFLSGPKIRFHSLK